MSLSEDVFYVCGCKYLHKLVNIIYRYKSVPVAGRTPMTEIMVRERECYTLITFHDMWKNFIICLALQYSLLFHPHSEYLFIHLSSKLFRSVRKFDNHCILKKSMFLTGKIQYQALIVHFSCAFLRLYRFNWGFLIHLFGV